MSDVLNMFTIYRRPKDYPDKFVVRRWVIAGGEPKPDDLPLAVVASLEEARRVLPPGLHCLGRGDNDDPCIVESWV